MVINDKNAIMGKIISNLSIKGCESSVEVDVGCSVSAGVGDVSHDACGVGVTIGDDVAVVGPTVIDESWVVCVIGNDTLGSLSVGG